MSCPQPGQKNVRNNEVSIIGVPFDCTFGIREEVSCWSGVMIPHKRAK